MNIPSLGIVSSIHIDNWVFDEGSGGLVLLEVFLVSLFLT